MPSSLMSPSLKNLREGLLEGAESSRCLAVQPSTQSCCSLAIDASHREERAAEDCSRVGPRASRASDPSPDRTTMYSLAASAMNICTGSAPADAPSSFPVICVIPREPWIVDLGREARKQKQTSAHRVELFAWRQAGQGHGRSFSVTSMAANIPAKRIARPSAIMSATWNSWPNASRWLVSVVAPTKLKRKSWPKSHRPPRQRSTSSSSGASHLAAKTAPMAITMSSGWKRASELKPMWMKLPPSFPSEPAPKASRARARTIRKDSVGAPVNTFRPRIITRRRWGTSLPQP
mmetsp:Transcript_29380/g.77697  ORF Transcript_29380/g.77697 Transcript_29380/m.77697 type:complete len:291 (-) Transcript_29380:986-1858(-)